MNIEAHVATLSQRHVSLEDLIHQETSRPFPDNLRLTELKREKLRIKEEMERLTH